MDYTTFVFYTVLIALVSVDRTQLKSKIITSPEILQVIDNIPHLKSLVNSLYKCSYATFFQSLSAITPQLQTSRYLSSHFKYYLREIRVLAYSQFLQSYKAAALTNMAQSFGVSTTFLDR